MNEQKETTIRKILSFLNKTIWTKPWQKVLVSTIIALLIIFIVVPTPKFDAPTATVVLSSHGHLMGARIADDGQWRFPAVSALPNNYEIALITYEDQWFKSHLGINPVSLVRALFLNIKHRKIVSGGSTISMQVARLSRNNPKRNVPGKFLEVLMAIKLEVLYSKQEILLMYASAAPYGGNVVGINSAAWRYFSRSADDLSWAEAAGLAVLPNAPALMHPGRNQQQLLDKRDRLLLKLLQKEHIDSLTYRLAIAEPLPNAPAPLPVLAPHVTDLMHKQYRGQQVTTSLDFTLQKKVNQLVERHNSILSQNAIHNMAALVVEVESGNVAAWVGNTSHPSNRYGNQVDIVTAPRSSGSILKPLLYAGMLHHGEILPNSLVPDVPVNFSGYAPKNFDSNFVGAVPASQALSKSLNVPAVEMLFQFGEARFLDFAKQLGISTLSKPASHYGLSLILGGGENTLFELAGVYASLARVLNHYNMHEGYSRRDFSMPKLFDNPFDSTRQWGDQPVVSAGAVWCTLQALQEVNRPDERSGWRHFSSSANVAWKTGTSYGFRDAWAIGIMPNYVVAVWAGNADGEGRPGLTGTLAAAPLLFDILDLLPQNNWFSKPTNNLAVTSVCAQSGYKAGMYCPHVLEQDVPLAGLYSGACPYHKLVHLSADHLWQVNASCYPAGSIISDSMFVLPPGMEWFYRKQHPAYRVLPPFMAGCAQSQEIAIIELLYPRNLQKIFVPRELDGSLGKVVFEAAHRNMDTRIFWYLNDELVAETDLFHQVALSPPPGLHRLTLVDEAGNSLQKRFLWWPNNRNK
jgi:penicillin-binding protein 1C